MTEPPIDDKRRARLTEKVAKLLAKAEDAERGQRQHEAEAYYDRAFAVMAEYGIDDVDARSDTDAPRDAEHRVYQFKGVPYAMPKLRFLDRISAALHCNGIRFGTERLEIYGLPEHLDRVDMLWTMLEPQVTRGAAAAFPPAGQSARVFRANWIRGFADSIVGRLSAQETQAAAQGGAVALYRSDAELARAAMVKAYPNVRATRARFRRSDAGYGAGKTAGDRAAMHRPVAAGQRAIAAG